jgi:hypothetical protein
MKKNTRTHMLNPGSTEGTFGFGKEMLLFRVIGRARRMLLTPRAQNHIPGRSNLKLIISMPIAS